MKLLLIDGLNLCRRIFSAGYRDDTEPQPDIIDRIARTCGLSLDRALAFHRPSHAAGVFESRGINWRHRLYAGYKQNRKPMPVALAQGLPSIQAGFRQRGVKTIEQDGVEADDIIASVATRVADRNGAVVILSTDRLQCQLLGPNIRIFDHFNQRPLDRAYVFAKFQVEPPAIPELLALAGDTGVDIAGVPGIGNKTAARLIKTYGNLDAVLANAEQISGRVGTALRQHSDDARLARQLFTLKTDLEIGVNLRELRVDFRTTD